MGVYTNDGLHRQGCSYVIAKTRLLDSFMSEFLGSVYIYRLRVRQGHRQSLTLCVW